MKGALKEVLAGQDLTERERQVLLAMARGLPDLEIAAELFLSASTVKTHVQRLMAKLGARDRANAVALGFQAGWFGPSLVGAAKAARPLVAGIPQCRWHPTIASLPKECPECARWVAAQRVVAELDKALPGGAR